MPDRTKENTGNDQFGFGHAADLSSMIQALTNNTCAGIYLAQDRKFVYINPFFEDISGYSRSELIGHNCIEFIHRDDREDVRKNAIDALKSNGNNSPPYEYRFIKKSGELTWVIERISSVEYMGRRAVLGIFMDINRRKLLEEVLVVYGERYRNILEHMQDSYFELDLHGNFVFSNYATCQNLGYTWDELNGKNYRMVVPEDSRKELYAVFHRVFETGESNKGFSHKVLFKNGSTGYAESSVSLLLNDSGKPVGFTCVGRNITSRKLLENALNKSEEKYRNILEQMQDWYFECDRKGNYIFVNDALCHSLGFSREEITGTNFRKLTPPEEEDYITNVYRDIYRSGNSRQAFAHKILCKDGSHKYIETSVTLLKNVEGRIIGYSGIGRDVTGHKQLLNALAESEEKHRTILEQLQDSYFEIDLAGNYTFVNSTTCNNMGYSKEELIGQSYRLTTPESELENMFLAFNTVYRTGIPNKRFPHKGLRKNGEIIFVETAISLRKNTAGEVIGFSALSRNITDRKLLEEELSRSEEKYRSILEQIDDAYYETDMEGNYTFANDQACRLLGRPRAELIGMNFRNIIPAEDIANTLESFNKIFSTGKSNNSFAHRIVRKEGSIVYADASISLARTRQGDIVGFRCLSRDVTERKRLEEELVRSEEKYRTILGEMEDAYYEVDLKGNLTFINEACCRDLCYTSEELLGLNFSQIVAKDEITNVFNNFNQVYRTGEANRNFSHKILRKDGTTGYAEATVSLIKNKQGKITGFRAVSRDVSARKKLEQKLAEMATHDFLTGLPNRILLNDRFYIAVAHAHRNDNKLAVMSLDLDSFKAVNDTLGHGAGDELLKMVSIRLSYTLRSSDTIARIGGDEFVMLLQEIHDLEDATAIADKIVESFKGPFIIEGHYLNMSPSIGMAIYPADGKDLDILMRKSDAAMYHAKREGGNRYKIFSDSDRQELKD